MPKLQQQLLLLLDPAYELCICSHERALHGTLFPTCQVTRCDCTHFDLREKDTKDDHPEKNH